MPKAGVTEYLQQNACHIAMNVSHVMRQSRRLT